MHWRALIAVAVATVGLVACTKSICDQFTDTAATIKTKQAACVPDAGNVDAGVVDAGASTCEQHVSDCTDDDKKLVDNFVTCVNNLPNCTPDTLTTWSTDFLACFSDIQNLSTACTNAISH